MIDIQEKSPSEEGPALKILTQINNRELDPKD